MIRHDRHDPFCGDDTCRGECVPEAQERELKDRVVAAAMALLDEDSEPRIQEVRRRAEAMRKFREDGGGT